MITWGSGNVSQKIATESSGLKQEEFQKVEKETARFSGRIKLEEKM